MERIEIKTEIKKYSFEELSEKDKELITKAKLVALRSYAPYSKFHVGAAIRLDNGEIIEGGNQENCAYPSGLCAERVATFYAHSKYPECAISELCIVACNEKKIFTENPITPCGSCRQVLIEYEKLAKKDIRILLCGTDGIFEINGAKKLLPLVFDESFL